MSASREAALTEISYDYTEQGVLTLFRWVPEVVDRAMRARLQKEVVRFDIEMSHSILCKGTDRVNTKSIYIKMQKNR